jgi:signal transduction histidine kinase
VNDDAAVAGLRLPVAAFRGVLLLLAAVLSVLPEGVNTAALTRVGLLAVVVAVITWRSWRGQAAVVSGLLEAAITGAFVAGSGGSTSPLLPYLLAPGLALGLAGGFRVAVLGGLVAALGLAGGRVASTTDVEPLRDLAVASGQWVLLSVAVGVMAAGARRVSTPSEPVDRYAEAHALLQQLRAVSARLPGGLDAPSAASALLERCNQVVPAQRSAVLVQRGGDQLVPIAVQGTRRVPWRAPLSAPGPLQLAWEERRSVVDVRKADKAGRRKGSALAVVPLLGPDEPFGLVVLESLDPEAFAAPVVDDLTSAVTASALQIETALLFEEVRSTATLEERDRLARQMHDGMAQDIAFLGYQLDALRMRAAADPELDAGLADVRGRLTALISDIRLSITDLRTSVDTERGLGGAVSSYVRAIGSGRDVAVHLSLQESTFRLPGESEVVLFRVVQAVAQDMRRTRRNGHFWVTLQTDPPSASLRVEHDGPMQDLAGLGLEEQARAVDKLGGTLTVRKGTAGGPLVVVELGGEDSGGHRPARR